MDEPKGIVLFLSMEGVDARIRAASERVLGGTTSTVLEAQFQYGNFFSSTIEWATEKARGVIAVVLVGLNDAAKLGISQEIRLMGQQKIKLYELRNLTLRNISVIEITNPSDEFLNLT